MNASVKDQKLIKLEAIRGFAAIYVVLHHTLGKGFLIGGKDFSFLFSFGQEAVILFFVLSGFVIQYAYSRSKDKTFRTFFFNRFFRIYIPLLVVFTAHYAILVAANKGLLSIPWWTLAGNILMLQDMPLLKPGVICEPFLGNAPLWSLSYEWWFYMLFFVLVNTVKEKASLTVYITGTIAAATYLLYPNFINRELMYLVIWWAGADMAKLYLAQKEITIKALKLPLSTIILIILLLVLNVKLHPSESTIGISPFLELRHFAFAVVAIVLAVAWKKMKWIGFNMTFGIFKYIAPVSFGIYISHWFLIAEAHYLDDLVSNFYSKLIIYSVVCILFSYITERIIYIWIKKLYMNYSKKSAPAGMRTADNALI